MLSKSLKISDTTKKEFLELKLFQSDQKIWQNYCLLDFLKERIFRTDVFFTLIKKYDKTTAVKISAAFLTLSHVDFL